MRGIEGLRGCLEDIHGHSPLSGLSCLRQARLVTYLATSLIMYVWLYVCMYVCMHVCMYVCMYNICILHPIIFLADTACQGEARLRASLCRVSGV